MKQRKVVQYPGRMDRVFDTLEIVCAACDFYNQPLENLLKSAKLPKGTLFYWASMVDDYNNEVGTNFLILLPTGEIFGGVALLKDGDEYDDIQASLIAAGRAVAIYKENAYHYGGVIDKNKIHVKKSFPDLRVISEAFKAIRGKQ